MPHAPARPCSRPYCSRLLAYGEECPEHGAKARGRQHDAEPTRRQKRRFYQSPAWRALREQVLEEEPICMICHRAPATCADHIKPVEEHPELALVRSNCQGACWSCHSAKTASKDGGFGNPRGRVKCSTNQPQRTALRSNVRAATIQTPGSRNGEEG